MRTIGLLICSAAVLATGLARSPAGQPVATPPYPGGLSPGPVAAVFAPGIVSGPDREYALAVDRAWTRVVFTRAVGDQPVLFEMDRAGGVWTRPAVAPFSGTHGDSHPFFSPDGSTLFFSSRRPRRGSAGGMALWFVERRGDGWSAPQPFEPLANQSLHAPAMAADGSILSSGLLVSEHVGGRYSPPRRLSPELTGTHPAPAPDGSDVIFSALRPGGFGSPDLYVSFRRQDGRWDEPINLGPAVNTPAVETSPTLSGDGRVLFFTRYPPGEDIWWVSADIVRAARRRAGGGLR